MVRLQDLILYDLTLLNYIHQLDNRINLLSKKEYLLYNSIHRGRYK